MVFSAIAQAGHRRTMTVYFEASADILEHDLRKLAMAEFRRYSLNVSKLLEVLPVPASSGHSTVLGTGRYQDAGGGHSVAVRGSASNRGNT